MMSESSRPNIFVASTATINAQVESEPPETPMIGFIPVCSSLFARARTCMFKISAHLWLRASPLGTNGWPLYFRIVSVFALTMRLDSLNFTSWSFIDTNLAKVVLTILSFLIDSRSISWVINFPVSFRSEIISEARSLPFSKINPFPV